MKIDVAGRVRNVALPKSRALLPLYEAITNSIQAIEGAGEKEGKITIKFTREPVLQLLDTDSSIGDIVSFEVIDNGVGFNQENFDAFQTSDTTYKAIAVERASDGSCGWSRSISLKSAAPSPMRRCGKREPLNLFPTGMGLLAAVSRRQAKALG